ncbi:cytoChrome c-type biogenesis protein CcmH [Roseibium sp. TrichSKD4]|uniref:cytochrome c-type biogenesis protein n=1 Tax=Roseibium sp. TrichSKD4 TaxID=744980 RepID=UPI0001E568E8|nr:cytochrome c-type biogenesis protein [Roseibium sp. TrichSKD4]EFO30567.1 cytoChrome c-type biogenesis protein CcmH [Roseibium sp. TrichSKD4]
MRLLSAFCLAFLVSFAPAFAIAPDEILDDPVLEERARGLSANLRCMVCQNQSIDDSDAPLAKDLRVLVRERLVAGDSDDEVIDYLVDRYGEFVLLKPRLGTHTLILWAAAPIALIAGVIGIAMAIRRRKMMTVDPVAAPRLSDEEKKRLEALLNSKGD